jgi:hypothetical protein
VIFSQDRQVNFSRTVWIIFHWRGTISNVSVMSSPSFASRPPQTGQAQGAGMTTRSRGRWAGKGARTGRRRVKLFTAVPAVFSSAVTAFSLVSFQLLELQLELIEHLATALGRLAVLFTPQLGDHQLHMRDHCLGTRCAGLGRGQFFALPKDQRVRLGKIGRERHGRRHAPGSATSRRSPPLSTIR